jgi:hypothetical protein
MTHDKLSALVVILTATTATAFGAPPTVSPNDNDNDDTEELSTQCPDAVKGVAMTIEKREGGVAIDFKTKQKDQVAPLQHLLREAATLVEHHSKLLALHPELVDDNTQMLSLPAMDIDVRDTASGARIMVRPENPGEIGSVRAQADDLKKFWDKNPCVQGLEAAPTSNT